MITKERLEELLEEDKVFYWVFNKEINMLHKLSMPSFWKRKWEFYSKDCFETKEDAEEYAEFGNITRTERLELPTFDELFDEIFASSFGIHTIQRFDNVQIRYKLLLSGVAWLFVVKGKDELFTAPLSRENYNEARRLCVKLFKGEGV